MNKEKIINKANKVKNTLVILAESFRSAVRRSISPARIVLSGLYFGKKNFPAASKIVSLSYKNHDLSVNARQRFALGYDAEFVQEIPVAKSGFFFRMTIKDQVVFAKRLAVLIKAGIPILSSLRMLEEQAHSRNVAQIMRYLREQVEKGQPLSAAMGSYRNIFGGFAVSIIRIGEMSGTLTKNLAYLADELKKKQELRRNLISALVYPAFIVLATIGIVILLTAYVFPKVLPIYKSFNYQLPWSTRFLIAVTAFMQSYWVYVVIGLVFFAAALILILRMPAVNLWSDRMILRLPLFGSLFVSYYTTNFTRTLGLLLESGMSIVECLNIAADSSGNTAFKKKFRQIAADVTKGGKISAAMEEDKVLFPAMVYQMVAVGEMAGGLSSSFLYLADMYEEEMKSLTKDLTTSIEPVLMIFMGLLVGFIALSIITPIYGITQSLRP